MVIRKTIKKALAKLKSMALSILWKILVWISRNAPQLFFSCKKYIRSEFKNSSTFQWQNDHVLNMRLISIWGTGYSNRKFPSSFLPLFQSLTANTFLWKWLWCAWKWIETACTTHFHMEGFTLTFVLQQRHRNIWMAYWLID